MKKTRSDVVISVGANDGKNAAAAAAAIGDRPSLLDVDDDNEAMKERREAKKSVAFGPEVVADDDAGDPNKGFQPDCCDTMCPTNYIESMLCKADAALCVCDITDNLEAVTGIQLCADDEEEDDDDDNEDIDNEVDDGDENAESAAVEAVDNSLVVVKGDSPSNTTCDETVSDAEASVHHASRSNSVLDESSGIDLQKDVGVPDEPAAAAAADTLRGMIETDKKDEDVDTTQEGSVLSETLSAFSGMLRNPFPDDVSPIKKAKAKTKTTNNAPETIVESPSTDNANDNNNADGDDAVKEEDTAAKTNTSDEKDKETKDHATTTSTKAPANSEDVVHHKSESDDNNGAETTKEEEKVGPAGQDDADANAVVADKNEASPADTTDNTANLTTEEEVSPEPKPNAANDNADGILDITSDLQTIATDATSRRIQGLLREAYGEQCFSADELESKGQVLLERYAGREALLIAALEKKIRERREAMEAVENAHKAALGELEGAVTTPAGETSATATATATAVPAPAPAASVESKKVKSRKSKLGKAKGLVKKFHKFSSPKKAATAASS